LKKKKTKAIACPTLADLPGGGRWGIWPIIVEATRARLRRELGRTATLRIPHVEKGNRKGQESDRSNEMAWFLAIQMPPEFVRVSRQ
jgi:hypothetical protein